jgi:hypothetical protein
MERGHRNGIPPTCFTIPVYHPPTHPLDEQIESPMKKSMACPPRVRRAGALVDGLLSTGHLLGVVA